ncbi:hypothetical protein J437_LFUL000933 [Ladona fulva]|uniref:Outer dense fiber protein 3 n=1 Tax=Ladona fulva TaxID=123851 RepID=A0A8K0K6T8_LADFU|nr:hypothetical protein J437_LFUL000933 [Ladona fulva]
MPENKPVIKIMAMEKGPGPAACILPPTVGYQDHDFTKYRNPAYSLGIRTALPKKFSGPGPIYSIESGTTRSGSKKKLLGYTIAERLPDLRPFATPGPGTYSPEKSKICKGLTPPAFSIGYRLSTSEKKSIPGPNAYDLPSTIGNKVPNKESAVAYSIAPRIKDSTRFQGPGPAAYGLWDMYTSKKRPPRYTIGQRIKPPQSRFPTPGPNEYYPPTKDIKKTRGISFGIKHSEYITLLIVE